MAIALMADQFPLRRPHDRRGSLCFFATIQRNGARLINVGYQSSSGEERSQFAPSDLITLSLYGLTQFPCATDAPPSKLMEPIRVAVTLWKHLPSLELVASTLPVLPASIVVMPLRKWNKYPPKAPSNLLPTTVTLLR